MFDILADRRIDPRLAVQRDGELGGIIADDARRRGLALPAGGEE